MLGCQQWSSDYNCPPLAHSKAALPPLICTLFSLVPMTSVSPNSCLSQTPAPLYFIFCSHLTSALTNIVFSPKFTFQPFSLEFSVQFPPWDPQLSTLRSVGIKMCVPLCLSVSLPSFPSRQHLLLIGWYDQGASVSLPSRGLLAENKVQYLHYICKTLLCLHWIYWNIKLASKRAHYANHHGGRGCLLLLSWDTENRHSRELGPPVTDSQILMQVGGWQLLQ